MIKLIMVVVIFILIGCEKVDTEALKALNSDKSNITKNFKDDELNKDLKHNIIDDKQIVVTTDINQTTKSSVKTQTNEINKSEYIIALQEIKAKRESLQKEMILKLSLAELDSETTKQLKDKDIKISKIQAQKSLDLAKIDLKKIREMEVSKQLIEKRANKNELEIATMDKDVTLKKDIELLKLYKIMAIVIGILLFIVLFIYFLIKRKDQVSKVQMHKDELKQQLHLKEIEVKGKNLDKMLEIISSNDVSKKIKNELLNSIKDSQNGVTIVDEKNKKGIIFKK